MKELRLKIHSVVDVITNSSTVIYTEASESAIETAKSIIDDILKVAGSGKTADDLFTFEVKVLPTDSEEMLFYNEGELEDLGIKLPQDLVELLEKVDKEEDYKKGRQMVRDWLAENGERFEALFSDCESNMLEYDGGNNLAKTLIIKTKDGEELPLAKKAMSLFVQEAWRDG